MKCLKKPIDPGPRGTRVLVLEQTGNKIMTGISKNNLFPIDDCKRPNCPGVNDACYKEGIVYQAICARCHFTQLEAGTAEPKDYIYLGESSRTLYTRDSKHIKDNKKASKGQTVTNDDGDNHSSWMWNQAIDKHKGILNNVYCDYTFDVLSTHRDPLTRQTTEPIRICKALETDTHIQANGKQEKFSPKTEKLNILPHVSGGMSK